MQKWQTQCDIKPVKPSIVTYLFIKKSCLERKLRNVLNHSPLEEKHTLSFYLSLLSSVRHLNHVSTSGEKKVVDMKSKQNDNERGQKEDTWEEAKRLKTDNWAAFKRLYVSSGSQKTQKDMLGSSPSGLLKKHPGQIVPSSPWFLMLFFLSLCSSHHLSLFYGELFILITSGVNH